MLEGRDAGTKGIELASQYIAMDFQKGGLQPKGDGQTFFQSLTATTGVSLTSQNTLQIGQTLFGIQKDFVPFAFSANGSAHANIVFAGYGISDEKSGYDDYKDLNVKDKIVLLLRKTFRWGKKESLLKDQQELFGEFRYKLLNARIKGAKAVLIVDQPNSNNKPQPSLYSLQFSKGLSDSGIIAMHVSWKVANALLAGSGRSLIQLWKQIEISQKPASFELKSFVKLRVELKKEKAKIKNVLGWIEGNHPTKKKEIIVIGAHYDHLGFGHVGAFPGNQGKIHTGADDNASGTSVMMDLARQLSKSKPDRSFLFIAFSGEERGLLGSAYFVKHPTVEIQNIVAMINLDMVGRLRENKLMVHGVGTAAIFEPLVKLSNGRFRFDTQFGKSGYGPSDHTSFYTQKIPVLFFFTGSHSEYHRPGDTFDTLNTLGMLKISRFVENIALRLDALDEKPRYIRLAPPKRKMKSRGGMRAYLGTIPDYGTKLKAGVRLTGVRAGAPADKAGIQAGDILLQIGKFPLRDLYDMVIALKHYYAGQTVSIIVLRNGKKVNLQALLKTRGNGNR